MAEAQQFAFRVRNVSCDATGSSFATTQGIVTNRHVASGSSSLQLSTWSGNDFNANVQSISEMPGPDLALVSDGSTTAPAILAKTNVTDGTQVWAAGYPEGDQLSLIPGIVLDYVDGTPYGVTGQVMELTNAVKPGNSGSPLLDSAGQVVGVVFALNTVTGNGVAMPVSTLSQYLATPGTSTYGGCV
jgi:S1-C subfamily serine protease